MTTLQLALALGALIGLGLAAMLYALVPAQPDLADVLARLSPAPRRNAASHAASEPVGTQERVGAWAQRTLPARLLGHPPRSDLAILRMSPASFYGRKVLHGLAGLALPGLLTGFFAVLGIRLPVIIPAGASLALAVILFLMPSRDVHADATAARADAARALSAYIELCALERNSGAGATTALVNAAAVGDSWIFTRISQELLRARYTGQPAWDALADLGAELAVLELAEIGDIMRLANDETTQVYTQLRARSASLRSALLSAELTRAGLVEERMYLPASFLGVVFLALLMTPPLLRLFGIT